jgi:hypothetical protein
VATKDIRTSNVETSCDVCGRTLLRGERAEIYLAGGERRSVCELCKTRALHEGWIKEGTVPAYDAAGSTAHRRRSLFSRLRARNDTSTSSVSRPTLSDELDGQAWARSAAGADGSSRSRNRAREPRHVRAVPTSVEQKRASAIELFNASEHRRTIAGVARSLGVPTVAVLPAQTPPSIVHLAVSWELCWYRYEVDLSDDQPNVRVAAQGSELHELSDDERHPNAQADESGAISLP